jgi:asparagine synthase (glutamine-hydrolysing)
MCGIVGVVGNKASRELVETMCSTIAHRGPDSDGFFVRPGVALGMRRLSIIDLSTGDQPIHNEDNTIWTVFNGEIYNFQNLREDLESRGHRFYTRGDTELLVHFYEELGYDLCASLRGMFAFAVWNEAKQELVLARDRLGKKPLYYTLLGDTLFFASEIKALLCCKDLDREIDPVSLDQYLTLGYVPGPRTMFRGISKLLPGHLMVFSKGRSTIREYWDVTSRNSTVPCSEREEEWLEWLDGNLQEAVRLRLVSDVPLGAFLSGGLDSSVVVALMRRSVTGPLKTFSVAFDEAGDYDERRHARQVADYFETEHYELVVRESPLDLLNRVVWHFDEPVADEAAVPTYLLSALARGHVKVVLTGEGADELFAGYGQYYYVQLLNKVQAQVPQPVRWAGRSLLGLLPSGGRGGAWVERTHKVLTGLFCPLSESFTQYGHLIPTSIRQKIYSKDFKQLLRSRGELPYERRIAYFGNVTSSSALNQALYVDTKTWLPDELLMKVDKMSMANSLEARAPYLDHKLVEGVFRMPDRLKVRKGVLKYLLRRWGRSNLPENIWQRPKHAFSVPYREWFNGPLKALVYEALSPPKIRNHGLLDAKAIDKVLQDYFGRGRQGEKETRALWALLCLHLWYDLFLGSNRAAAVFSSCGSQRASARGATARENGAVVASRYS